MQLSLIARLGASILIYKELQSSQISNHLFNYTLNLYSLKGKSDGLRPFLLPQIKLSSGLLLLLQFLTLYLGILLSKTPFTTPHTLLIHTLYTWTPLQWRNISWCIFMQFNSTLQILNYATLATCLGLMTPLSYYPQVVYCPVGQINPSESNSSVDHFIKEWITLATYGIIA